MSMGGKVCHDCKYFERIDEREGYCSRRAPARIEPLPTLGR